MGQNLKSASSIDITRGASNLLQVVQLDGVVWIYINGVLAGSFATGNFTGGTGTSLFLDDDFEGSTEFSDFAVWEWDPVMFRDFPELDPDAEPTPGPTQNPAIPLFGPVSGAISHDSEDGYLAVHRGPSIEGDVMVEVTFENPFAPNESHWNYGILFDSQIPETYHHIQVSSVFGGAYNHWRRAGRDEEVRGRLSEDLHGLELGKNGENHIRFIILETGPKSPGWGERFRQ